MFTGLVLGTGEIVRIAPGAQEARFTIRPQFPSPQWVQGESIAVNGTCLSVETFSADSFTAYASQETLQLTNLQYVRTGSRVNLERALALGDRLGGHLVSGHVDGIAILESVVKIGASRQMRFSFPEEYSPHVLPKGSITLDGISLTVNHCGSGFLEVNIIPDTQSTTTITSWVTGQRINFETDIIGKYVQNMLGVWQPQTQQKSALTMDFLRENGF